jgi:hypothetical protein
LLLGAMYATYILYQIFTGRIQWEWGASMAP